MIFFAINHSWPPMLSLLNIFMQWLTRVLVKRCFKRHCVNGISHINADRSCDKTIGKDTCKPGVVSGSIILMFVFPLPLDTVPALALPVVFSSAIVQDLVFWIVAMMLYAFHACPAAYLVVFCLLHFGGNRCAALFVWSTGFCAETSLRRFYLELTVLGLSIHCR